LCSETNLASNSYNVKSYYVIYFLFSIFNQKYIYKNCYLRKQFHQILFNRLHMLKTVSFFTFHIILLHSTQQSVGDMKYNQRSFRQRVCLSAWIAYSVGSHSESQQALDSCQCFLHRTSVQNQSVSTTCECTMIHSLYNDPP
jgi:hypothetical protein